MVVVYESVGEDLELFLQLCHFRPVCRKHFRALLGTEGVAQLLELGQGLLGGEFCILEIFFEVRRAERFVGAAKREGTE